MIAHLPLYISIVFALTTFATLILFYFAVRRSNIGAKANAIVVCLLAWLILQGILTLKNVYTTAPTAFPPKFLFLVFPPLVTIIILFISKKGRTFIDSLPVLNLTYLNVVRIPVELVLYWLFLNKTVPQLMTFAGRNLDILAGLTAPLIAYFGLQQKNISKKVILIWNFISLALLINIILLAVFSAPFAFQKLAFDQPNIAVLNFPFSWLPAYIVPTVFFGHLVSIRQLLKAEKIGL